MIRFIDVMKDRFGVELVCRTMRAAEVGFVTARGYRAVAAGVGDRPRSDWAAHALARIARREAFEEGVHDKIGSGRQATHRSRAAKVLRRRTPTLKADILPLQALDMAAFDAGGDLTGLTHRSDHGSNYMALVYTDRIAELGAVPSTGTVGDSYDNAMAEAINALYKTELIPTWGSRYVSALASSFFISTFLRNESGRQN